MSKQTFTSTEQVLGEEIHHQLATAMIEAGEQERNNAI